MFYADTHTHTRFSHDATEGGSHIDSCETALSKGLDYIAFTEHYDVDDIAAGRYRETDLVSAHEGAVTAIKKYEGRLKAVWGIELGDAPMQPEMSDRLLGKWDFGFVIGSLHSSRRDHDFFNIDFSAMSDDYLKLIWYEYLEDLISMAKWALGGGKPKVDTIAHITYPCRYYVQHGRAELLDMARAREAFAELFGIIIHGGIALECNTSGLRQPIGRTLPDEDTLRLYRSMGGELITIGSDAHRARDIGAGIAETTDMLVRTGFKYITVFENRQPHMMPVG